MLIGLPQPVLHRDVPKLAADYDYVVIDGPPRNYEVTRSAIAAADLVLIPVQPSGADFWASRETVKLAQEAHAFKETQKTVLVVLRTDIPDRVAYAEVMTAGTTMIESQPKGPGANDIRALLAEIQELLA